MYCSGPSATRVTPVFQYIEGEPDFCGRLSIQVAQGKSYGAFWLAELYMDSNKL